MGQLWAHPIDGLIVGPVAGVIVGAILGAGLILGSILGLIVGSIQGWVNRWVDCQLKQLCLWTNQTTAFALHSDEELETLLLSNVWNEVVQSCLCLEKMST